MAHNALAQLWVPDQLALRGSSALSALMRCHPKVSRVLLGKGIIRPEVPFDLSEDRGFVTVSDT